MLFNSHEFLLLFLPLCVAVAMRLRHAWLLAWICAASCVFYAFAGHVWFLVPMAFTSVLDFMVGRAMARRKTKRERLPLLLVSLVLNLSLLGYFKYSGLLVGTLSDAARILGGSGIAFEGLRVILPAGISFYTLQTLSYVFDIYRGDSKAESSFWAYLAFVSFFPHLVAGPLTRHNQLLNQLHAIAKSGATPRWAPGIGLFALGLAKKVIVADRIALWNDPLIGSVGTLGAVGAWVCVLGYGMQIYFDFSGYSDMAVGLGRLFGIELPQNFDRPYASRDPGEFWRRWHITLSNWLRDYVFLSMRARTPRRSDINLMFTMALAGLWHGASWVFVVWGIYHGALLVMHRRLKTPWAKMPKSVQVGVTFILVSIGWVFFRAKTFDHARAWFVSMSGARGLMLGVDNSVMKVSLCVTGALAIVFLAPRAAGIDYARLSRTQWAALGVTAAVAVVMMNYSSRFLYFQF